jgi:hypothetical protein
LGLVVVAIFCASLQLTPSWDEERAFVVRATEAIRLRREDGYEQVPAHRAGAYVNRLGPRDIDQVRGFVARVALRGVALTEVDDRAVLALLRSQVRVGELAVIRQIGDAATGGASESAVDQRQLIRSIDRYNRGRLAFAGRQYKLVADSDLGKLAGRDSYEVVRHDEAVRVLTGIAEQPDAGDVAPLLRQASGKLTADWRAPLQPDGIVLLRRLPVVAAARAPDPVLTPSQVKALLKKTDWIEIEVVESDDTPYQGEYRIDLPNHSAIKGRFDDHGGWEDRDVEPGTCKLVLPEFAAVPKQPWTSGPGPVGALGVVVFAEKQGGAKVAGAKVSIAGPASRDGTSDPSGLALFADVPIGAYTITVELKGFQTASQTGSVRVDATTEVDITLVPSKAVLALAGVAEAKKRSVGGLLVRSFDGNDAPRKKLTVSMVNSAPNSKVLLQLAGDKIRIYDAATGGTEVKMDGAANLFAAGALPRDLWIEGVSASDAMRDIEVSASIDGRPAQKDAVKLTVLWVETPNVAFSGRMSAKNAKRAAYQSWTLAGTDQLGLQEYNNSYGARMGFGSEASAVVHPRAFRFPGSNLKLERDYYYRDYQNRTLRDQGNYSAHIPPGNDTGPATARDDDPSPNDTIYDWDAAGLPVPNVPQNTILRTRNNFKAFASITVEGKSVRCSPVREYRICFSQKQTAAPAGAQWQIINPPDVAGDNVAGHGTTKVTWDLT